MAALRSYEFSQTDFPKLPQMWVSKADAQRCMATKLNGLQMRSKMRLFRLATQLPILRPGGLRWMQPTKSVAATLLGAYGLTQNSVRVNRNGVAMFAFMCSNRTRLIERRGVRKGTSATLCQPCAQFRATCIRHWTFRFRLSCAGRHTA